MLERLGHVFGWIGSVLAILTILVFVFGIYVDAHNINDVLSMGGFGCAIAVMFFLMGRALRYIFAGKHR